MTARSALVAFALACACALQAGNTAAQPFPSKPIRFVIGPAPDVLARLVGQKLSEAWGQQVVVDQRPGAGGIIAAETVAKSPPDGYTWLLSTGAYPTVVGLYPKLPFDFVRDFEPVSLLATIPFLLVAHPSLPVTSVRDLLKLARARPGQINYASSGTGTTAHLAMEMFKNMAKVKIVHVPYKGVAAGLVGVVSGEAQLMFAIMQAGLPHVKAGKLRALAVSGSKRSQSAPDVPTIAESGVPGYEFVSWNGVHVPAGTPKAIVSKIHADLVKVVAMPDVQARMASLGMEVAGSTPEELGALVKSDIAKWGKVIKEAGVRID
ncbi:MAG TPA: tripartite tricarboxylate transporter substrate binding protein [Burkholderiales bacterium]|nr:tripartite tricarboxylate transporter substrate binding protein [Burkholderiales bacterium]